MKNIKRLLALFLIVFTMALSSCMFFHGSEHEFGDDVVLVEPTCTDTGKGYRVCSKCNLKEEFDVPALGHKYTNFIVEREPTCLEKGLKKRTCDRCGYVDEVEIDALGHHFDDPVVVKAPTCEEKGLLSGECTRCHLHSEQEIDALGHDFDGVDWTIIIHGDCQHQGKRAAKCNRCNQEIKVNYGGSHNYEDSVFYNDLGHGVIKSKCSVCGEYSYSSLKVDYTKLYGYKVLGEYPNGNKLQAMYKKMFEDLSNVFNIDKDYSDTDNILSSYEYSEYGLSDNEATIVYSTLNNENYQFYFLNPGFVTSQIGTKKEIRVTISPDFYLNSQREDYDSKLEEEIIELSEYLKSKSHKELDEISLIDKIKYLHNYLCDNLEYAKTGGQPEKSSWAHSIEGLIYKNKGVCETYAESFHLFSLLLGIETICVSGTANGGVGDGAHKWNYTKLDDKWYLVDVTWDDQTTIKYDYFLVGSYETSHDHFPKETKPDEPIEVINEQRVITFQIDLPTLSTTRYE